MKKVYEDIKNIFESKISVRILYGIGIAIVVLLIFSAGATVGFHKASFGNAWGEHYNENFGIGHRGVYMGGVSKIGMMDYFPNAHGATGTIIKTEPPNIIVAGKDNIEKIISISDDTKIQKGRENILPADLGIDDFVVIIGTPNKQGIIEAKLVRVVPNPESL